MEAETYIGPNCLIGPNVVIKKVRNNWPQCFYSWTRSHI
ncbi:hypothetical protein HHJ45_09035 [Escherichia coli]|nr:hypothetical protein HHJ45_09035 [Escherichia coli]